jgi:hypothetical protein
VAGGGALTFNGRQLDVGGLLRHAVLGGSIGVGTVIAYAVYAVAKAQPALIIELVRSWGVLGLLSVVGMVLWDRRQGETIAATRESAAAFAAGAAAQQQLAAAVNKIAEKDDERFRELELTVGVTARNTREIIERLHRMEQKPAAKGHSA